jgi:hypothetical protein
VNSRNSAHAGSASLATLFWQNGRRIRTDILKERRAEYAQAAFGWLRFAKAAFRKLRQI